MRLFAALDPTPEIFDRIVEFQQVLRSKAPHEKWVRAETLHVTLKFIGETRQPNAIKQELDSVRVPPFAVRFRGIGFFTPKHPRVFYIGVEGGGELNHLAKSVDLAVSKHSVAREKGPYNPHLTLARSGSGRPTGTPQDRKVPEMHILRDKLKDLEPPDFGTMTATEFFLYQSELSSSGAKYIKFARYELK